MYTSPEVYGKLSKRMDNYIPYDNYNTSGVTLSHLLGCFNLDQLFRESGGVPINAITEAQVNITDELLNKICHERKEELEFIPRCECGKFYGKKYEDKLCPDCLTKVKVEFIDKITHNVWIEIDEAFPPLIHPVWYWQMDNIRGLVKGQGGGSLAKFLFDPKVDVPLDLRHIIEGKGFAYFYLNHETIFERLFDPSFIDLNIRNSKESIRTSLAWLKLFHDEYKDVLFTRHFPILHKSLHPIIGKSSAYKKGDGSLKDIFKAAIDITALSFTSSSKKKAFINRKLGTIYQYLINYYEVIIRKKLCAKRGLLRQHDLGSRCHFTLRAVCVPIHGPHVADEVILPWRIMVNSHRHEIINFLTTKHGYTVNKALKRIFDTLVNEEHHDPLIEECLNKLIEDSPWKGLPILLGRNPTLRMHSIQLLFVTKVDTDVKNNSLKLSSCILRAPNADVSSFQKTGKFLMSLYLVTGGGHLS